MTQLSVIGRACRLPGANSVSEFWDVLDQGRCTVSRVPRERFAQSWYMNPRKGEAGKAYTFAAGILDDVWGFDPAVFSITPREARQMDPQQRILLQLVWEALEDAGVPPSSLSGRCIGVYVGASSMDYSHRQFFDPAGTDSYLMTGNTLSLISNRISYIFDLQGPSLTIDTACSSSLVALDYAAQDLRAGRVDTAIVGGINALLSPFNYMGFCAASMLSPDGLCRPFDHRGNGYVRAEGGVVMLLQRANAESGIASTKYYGDIVTSGMNSDGRTSGVALPSSEQQGALLHSLYEASEIDPNDLAFVEAHGTGTLVGDPAEASALGRALGVHRNQPLPIGSAKSNVGHLEPASGLVGLLKAQLALEYGRLPRSLHIEKLNPDIAFGDLNLQVAADAIKLDQKANSPALAGVNNFGFGGTNVHVVISAQKVRPANASEAIHDPIRVEVARCNKSSEDLFLLSAHCRDALQQLAGSYSERLTNADDDKMGSMLVAAAAHRRDRLSHRLVVGGRNAIELAQLLADYAATGEINDQCVEARAIARDARVALVFSGNGSQWDGMGRLAFQTSASFKRHFRAVDQHYRKLTTESLESLLFAEDLGEKLVATEVAQPLLFALQVALARSLQDQGLSIGATLGHSVGEVAAAHIAGALELPQAVAVIRARSRHQELAAGKGLMAAVNASCEDVQSLLDAHGLNDVEIAAHNAPNAVTISGDVDQVRALAEIAEQAQIFARVLDINYPFHSARLDVVRNPLLETLNGLSPVATDLNMYSTVTGKKIEGDRLVAEYWWDNVRQLVRFDAAVAACAADGHQLFIEIGPRAILRKYISDIVANGEAEARVLTSLDVADKPACPPVRATLARAIASGATFDAETVFGMDTGEPVSLPTYAWQNKEYLFAISTEALDTFNTGNQPHPLLGLQLRPEDYVWDSHLDTGLIPFLNDHQVGGKPIMPGTGYVEMALSAAAADLGTDEVELRDLDFVQVLELHDEQCQAVRTRIDSESATIEVSSRPRLTDDERQTHMRTRFAKRPSEDLPAIEPFTRVSPDDGPVLSHIYRLAEKFGLNYGPSFQRIIACREIGENIIEVELSPASATESEADIIGSEYVLHPVDFDACFHGLNVVYERFVFGENKLAYVPVHLGRLRVFASGHRIRSARINLVSYNKRAVRAGFELFAEDGTLVAIADNVRFRASSLVHRIGLGQAAYHIAHTAHPLPGQESTSAALLLGDLAATLSKTNRPSCLTERFEENKVLLEMAARRAAFDVVLSLAGAERRIDLAPSGSVLFDCGGDNDNVDHRAASLSCWNFQAPDCAAALTSLVSLLASSDLATPLEEQHRWQLVAPENCMFPALNEIVATILQDDPAWSSECVLLLRAVDHLKEWLAAADPVIADIGSQAAESKAGVTATPSAADVYSSSMLEHFFCASPLAASQIDRVVRTLHTVVAGWPSGHPLRILQLGIAAGGLTRALLPLLSPKTGALVHPHLVVADTDESWVARLANLYVREANLEAVHVSGELEELASHGDFDVVVSANGLHALNNCGVILASLRERLADGAIAIFSETEPTALCDVIFAGTKGWFDTALFDGVAYGRLRTATDWASAVESAGITTFADIAADAGFDVSGSSFFIGKAKSSAAPSSATVQPADIADAQPLERHVLVLPGDSADAGLVQNLQLTLREAGLETSVSTTQETDLAGALERAFAAGSMVPDIVFLSPAHNAEPERQSTKSSKDTLLADTSALTRLLNGLGERAARVWVVAEGGARAIAGLGTASPVQSGVWAYGRTALNEFGHLDIRLVDIGGLLTLSGCADRLAGVLLAPREIHEMILTENACHALQVRRGPPPMSDDPEGDVSRSSDSGATVLELTQSGDLDALAWVARDRRAPATGEVEIEIAATGLNFRDVMWSLGLLPEEALEDGFAGPTVGFECAGRVVRVGKDVSELQTGDRVIAMAPACFASHVTVTSDAVAKLPDTVGLDDAASIPVAFLTAYYALDYLAHLRRGEWVLIHGAAGGVGLAAVQIAKRIGARIIATAGTDEKRAVLTALGADHVLDTRSLEFVDEVRAITGTGVDVLLNSLAGEAMERSIDLMRPFGRFLELGKRDFYANTKVGLRPFRRNVSYFGIDADQLLTYRPDVVRTVFREIMDGFADGTYTPLPHRSFESASVVDAFRLMQKSGHIGKIIVKAPAATAGIAFADREFKADADGTHVLVGGTGGFGLEMSRWLADRGATNILLTSRSGGEDAEVKQTAKKLAARGVSLKIARCDVTDAASLETLLNAERAKRPIAGIAHTAMVLDDSLISNLTPERTEAVLSPKVTGADHLDRLTRQDDLQYFLLFSSAAAMFGNPGQANYTAANGYLDGLARARVAAGYKAMAVAWGAISDVGVLTRQKDTAESLARHTGGIEFTARDGLNLLARLLVRDDCNATCANVTLATMNWAMAADMLGIMSTPAYALIRRDATSVGDHGDQVDIRAAIHGLDDVAAQGVLADFLAREVAAIFRMPVQDISLKRSLADMGMDSLMGLELRMAAQQGLGIDIPIVSISDGTTINDIVGRVLSRLRGGESEEKITVDPGIDRKALLAKHVSEDLDDQTLDQLEKRVEAREAGLKKVV